MPPDSRDHRIVDEVDRICGARILRLAVVVVVGNTRVRIERYVLEHTAEAQRIPDLRLVLLGELDALGIASAFEVEDTVGAPSVLVIADQVTRRISRECRLTCAGQSEE